MAGPVLLMSACSNPPYVPPEGLPLLFEAVEAEPAQYESAMAGCVQVHNVWKAQVRAVHLTSRRSIADRLEMLRDSTYAPYSEFWDGYMSDFFSWARHEFDLAGDPRRAFPTKIDLPRLIADVTAQVEEMTGLRGCAEWYLVYGHGQAALEASAAVYSASLIATLALRTSTRGPGGDRGHDARGTRTGPFWDADSLAAAAAASRETATAAQANAQDAWAGRDTVDSALMAEMFRLADAAWEHTVDAAEASSAAWDALSSGVGAVDAASLSATRAAVKEMRAARENFFDAAAAARPLSDSVTTSPDSAALAVRDAVASAMADYYRLPDEAADSTWNLAFEAFDLSR